MKLKIRPDATAAQIARVHRHLAQARKELLGAALTSDSCAPLEAASHEALVTLILRMNLALYGLEVPFMQRAAGDAPFANPNDPDIWERWLAEKENGR